jgi:hypothetical protein
MFVYCCADLLFSTKVRSTAEAMSLSCRPARDVEALSKRLEQIDDGKLNEPVTGVVVDMDLGDAALQLIGTVKAYDASLPVVAFGSHVATALLNAAREAGADFVMPRSMFTNTLPDVLMRVSGKSE